ncbi:CubicO group peptidase (beta-lactamase class C family) [Chryseobacterium sp. 52]|uniref:serine hydrolase domain-containing protein n=1 Tax=Chryseobacterium sp. 52 TaxID=2035213 RepID=UPI000C19CAD2|nr:serine hydrolase domain-containing protein [Chryseobacterium sp. 52]PIF44022.1 CubicO group peptidase (beta-lactamase class C family) [Chryseobacterium sp. 52]
MKQAFKGLILLFSILLMSCKGYGQDKDDYSKKIDSLIQTTNPRSFNGVILITQKGKTKYTKAFGFSNFEKKIPLTTNDNFIIMSNSKQVTAVLILKEVEKGKIDLRSPIRKYLPDLKQTWADTVTVHQLLNFSAGITDIDKPLIFKPGTDFKYGNTAYIMLGKIVEKVTGRKYIDVANDLFKEFKMKNTFCFELDKPQNRVQGYRNTNNNFKLVDKPIDTNDMVSAAGVVSNIKDLNIWDAKLHNGKILNPATYKRMISYDITAQHSAFGKEKIGYGYGVRISDKTPIKYIGHTGGGSGFVSFKVYFPTTDVDVVVLENQSNENFDLFYEFEIKIREIIMNSSLMKK